MTFDLAKSADAAKTRIQAGRQRQLEDGAYVIQSTLDDIDSGKKPLTLLADIVDACTGKSTSLASASSTSNGGTIDPNAALQVVLASDKLPLGVRNLIRRATVPNDPGHLPVADDGTPMEITNLRRDLDAERNKPQPLSSGSSDLSDIATALGLDPNASKQEILDQITNYNQSFATAKAATEKAADAFNQGSKPAIGREGWTLTRDPKNALKEALGDLKKAFGIS